MSNTPIVQDLDSSEEATRLLALAKAQRGGDKKLIEGRQYLVITQQYIDEYGSFFPEDYRVKLIAQHEMLQQLQLALEEKMGKRPFLFKLFYGVKMLEFNQQAAALLRNAKAMSCNVVTSRFDNPLIEEVDTLERAGLFGGGELRFNTGQGVNIVSVPTDSDTFFADGPEFEGETTIMYQSSDGNAPRAAFIVPLDHVEEQLEKSTHGPGV